MADQRTMAEFLRAPTEGYAETIMVPLILAEQFELKHSLVNMMTSDQFLRLEKDNPHDHIRWFNKITFTIKYKDVPNLTIKLMLFPFSLADQDSLNYAAGANLLERRTQDVLMIIENKSKVRNSQNKSIVSQVKSSDANSSSFEIAKLTHAVNQQTSVVTTAMTAILKQFQATPPPASVKVVEEIYVTCGGAHPYYHTTSFHSPSHLLKEFADELTLITFPLEYDDDLQFDIEFDLKETEYLLHHHPTKGTDSSVKDSIDQDNLTDLNDNFVDSMPEMFTDEHALDYSSLPLFDEYDDDFLKDESGTENVYDDPFDSKGEKMKESKLLMNELDLPCDFLPSFEYDSFSSEDFSRVDALPSTNNEDK
nr:reverse transcriptase domain-containing protein [Tanacetum cinerariifolium]